MYNVEFVCTYKMMDTDEDKEDVYRIQFLQAFNLREYNDNVINKELSTIYNKIKDCPQYKEICEACSHKEYNGMMMLMCLFSFDTFDLFHRCLIDFFTYDTILEETKKNIIEAF